ncbi:pyruvate, water dikinase [Halioglobus maricola]|uniref:Pyruvate, water dikinase n=1 Tax=Halioglobus maricola TaxID=2601894 RepID=A0A5P9NPD4_9GAMM|nr:PEP/pyruvate-binding domain-containing protein [Halioglobus maricola]QFU76768.1 pyruvate, water dikinase [Halioglobus maricola]
MTTSKIITLDQITDDSCGGKAHGLAQLQSMGLRVPPAFVILAASADAPPADLSTHLNTLGTGPVAVRSSAQGEDGAEASFAGQYDTVLNVQGEDAVQAAIRQCVESAGDARAEAYQQRQTGNAGAVMNVVVQRMVNARYAGVVFTADPVSARRDHLVIDAVAGLGEALVSGEATPDHYVIDPDGVRVASHSAGDQLLLDATALEEIAADARRAEAVAGQPLDLEWAIDEAGVLYWLQARPITTLPADLGEFDTELPRPDDVLTISNVSEMMPGAVSPLTGSFTGWGIDYGLQDMQVKVGARAAIDPAWQVTAWGFGHLFLNLTGNVVMGAAVLGSSVEQTAQTLCGRVVPELKPLPPQPLWRRVINTGKLLHYCWRAPSVVQDFDAEMAAFQLASCATSREQWAEIEGKAWFFNHAMAVHIQSSALSGFTSAIVENMVARRSNQASLEEQAEAVRLLAGASEVESAMMLAELDELVAQVAEHPQAPTGFAQASIEDALSWLRSQPDLAEGLSTFLRDHGHRGYRELCVRDPSWGDDPATLVQSMQAAVSARLAGGVIKQASHAPIDEVGLSRGLRFVLPRAHNAIRRREHTKSHLVRAAHRFKLAFAQLGALLAEEGHLPDADLVYFFGMDELAAFVAAPGDARVAQAELRRKALPFQQKLSFPEISVGKPQPVEVAAAAAGDGALEGRPASTGVVEGTARVALTLADAASLQPGEILVTPITDIGWTPYFSMIAGLVTDLGSSVSHGAVIAREYGLPCVVNTRVGTRVLQTGDRVRLDGDSGLVTRL